MWQAIVLHDATLNCGKLTRSCSLANRNWPKQLSNKCNWCNLSELCQRNNQMQACMPTVLRHRTMGKLGARWTGLNHTRLFHLTPCTVTRTTLLLLRDKVWVRTAVVTKVKEKARRCLLRTTLLPRIGIIRLLRSLDITRTLRCHHHHRIRTIINTTAWITTLGRQVLCHRVLGVLRMIPRRRMTNKTSLAWGHHGGKVELGMLMTKSKEETLGRWCAIFSIKMNRPLW